MDRRVDVQGALEGQLNAHPLFPVALALDQPAAGDVVGHRLRRRRKDGAADRQQHRQKEHPITLVLQHLKNLRFKRPGPASSPPEGQHHGR